MGAIQVLFRLLPFVMEDRALIDAILWVKDEESMGLRLCEALMKLLFFDGFTIKLTGEGVDVNTYKPDTKGVDMNLVWRKGVSTVGEVPNSRVYGNAEMEQRRKWILRVIIVLISQCLYFKQEEYLTILNPFCVYFTNRRTPLIKNFYFSLLNTIIDYDTVGKGLPYLSHSFKYDPDVLLIEACFSVLNCLNEYRPPTVQNVSDLVDGGLVSLQHIRDYYTKLYVAENDETVSEEKKLEEVTADLAQNEFYRLLQVIHGKANLEPLKDGFNKLIGNFIDSRNTFLPESVVDINF